MKEKSVLWTESASCRDCNRCVRNCPVKAIEKTSGQARVVHEQCLLCGACVRECPQQAKAYLCGVTAAKKLLRNELKVVVSIAPSYLSTFSKAERQGLPGILRQLGFDKVTETAVGAELVSAISSEIIEEKHDEKYISSACPAVVSYINKYRPQASSAIMGVVSPMIAHARLLKTRYGDDTAVVFIGPCIAKKEEAHSDPGQSVDAVLTFKELRDWIDEEGLNINASEESEFDGFLPQRARIFPVEGGLQMSMDSDNASEQGYHISASGPEEVMEAVDYLLEAQEPLFLEALFCSGGCLGGAGVPNPGSSTLFKTRKLFTDKLRTLQDDTLLRKPFKKDEINVETSCVYNPDPLENKEPDEHKIREVLSRIGKETESDELNCGACGYNSCREKAAHVIKGMAEIEMCLPFMRENEQHKTDALIINSPNAIVILDSDLNIINANPRFHELFMTSEYCHGKEIDYFMDPTPFKRVKDGEIDLFDETVVHNAYNLTYQQIIYKIGVEDKEQLIAVLVNLTRSKKNEEELDLLRKEALERAEEVLENQVEIAQEVTRLLGRSTGESQLILQKLTDLVKKGDRG